MNLQEENLNIENPAPENSISIEIEDDISEPSLVDKIYTGEVDYRSLDGSTRKTVLNEVYNKLDDRKKFLWDKGWKDRPFFLGKNRDGSEAPWKDADEFERTLKIPSVAKERDNHLLEENRKLKQEIERISNLTKLNTERGLQAEEAQIDAEIRNAKEYSDFDAYEKALEKKKLLQDNKNQIEQYYQKPPEEKPLPPSEIVNSLLPEDRDAILDFRAENIWFGKDAVMSEFLTQEVAELNKIAPSNMSFKQKLELAKKRTSAAFPSKFPNKPTNYMQTNNIENTPFNPKSATKMTFEKLSDMDKKRVDRMVLSNSKDYPSREAVVNKYFNKK